MKKIISAALSLLMLLTLFAGCGDKKGNSDLENAKDYLVNMYQTAGKDEVMELLMDKDVLSVVTIDGVTYSVEWTVTVTQGASDAVKVAESDKENHVSIDVPDLPEEDVLFTATATIKDADGNTEAVNFSYKVTGLNIPSVDDGTESDIAGTEDETSSTTPATSSTPASSGNGSGNSGTTSSNSGSTVPSSMTAIVDEAYKLAEGKSLSYTATLTGKVVTIDDAYDADFQNITVTIQVSGRESKPIKCYRMKGTGVDKVAKGDTITVTGTLKNYYGEIEFDTGCVMNKRVSGGGTATTVLTDPAKIMDAAYALEENTQMEYDVTLTGKVTKINSPYDSTYQNISVYITVTGSGKELLCYRMKGDEADKVVKGDTITVTGRIKNYNGIIEMDAGCTMRKRVSGGGTVVTAPSDPKEIVKAAYALEPGDSLPYKATLTGKIISIDTEYSEQYGNITVTIEVSGCEDMPIKCYRMKGDGAAALKVGDTITVSGTIKNYQHSSGDCEVEFDSGCTFTK